MPGILVRFNKRPKGLYTRALQYNYYGNANTTNKAYKRPN